MMLNDSRKSRAHFDIPLTALVYSLSAFGILAVSVATFSISSQPEDTWLNYIASSYYGLRQTIFFLVSPLVVGVITYAPYELLRRHANKFYLLACALLLITLVSNQAQGVKAWTDIIWGYTIQPSEFVKLACIVALAKYLETNDNPLGDLKSWLRLGMLMGLPALLTLAQGEMGSVLVMAVIFIVMMYFGGIRGKLILIFGVIAAIGIALLGALVTVVGTDNYRIVRILSFIRPDLVDSGATYQVDNSKIAIGSGGFKGVGIFVQGSFSQLDYVPEDWTDFIFATIGEAWGFLGCAAVILVYLAIILRMLYLSRYTPNRFGQMVILGVMAMLLFHVFENVGMTTGLMPVTGIPLPFLSYGGSNMMTNMAGLGLVLNVVKNRSVSSSPSLALQTTYVSKRYSGRS